MGAAITNILRPATVPQTNNNNNNNLVVSDEVIEQLQMWQFVSRDAVELGTVWIIHSMWTILGGHSTDADGTAILICCFSEQLEQLTRLLSYFGFARQHQVLRGSPDFDYYQTLFGRLSDHGTSSKQPMPNNNNTAADHVVEDDYEHMINETDPPASQFRGLDHYPISPFTLERWLARYNNKLKPRRKLALKWNRNAVFESRALSIWINTHIEFWQAVGRPMLSMTPDTLDWKLFRTLTLTPPDKVVRVLTEYAPVDVDRDSVSLIQWFRDECRKDSSVTVKVRQLIA